MRSIISVSRISGESIDTIRTKIFQYGWALGVLETFGIDERAYVEIRVHNGANIYQRIGRYMIITH